MAYELDLSEDFASTVRQVARERLDKGAAVLREQEAGDPVRAVHEARKEVKKSRSLLRLARPGMSKRVYRHENQTLRDAARTVAHVRDADVMVETIDALHERFTGQLPARAFSTLRKRLVADAERSRADTGAPTGEELVDALATVSGRVDDWPLAGASWSAARKGLTRSYVRGRKALAKAESDPTTENLHDLRKRVKDLWYQERLLKTAWPAVIGAQADEAHRLADLLGDEHDLAVLAERLADAPPTAHSDAVVDVIGQRREELRVLIRDLAGRVYAEKPKAFSRRLQRYMRTPEAADQPVPA